MPFKESLGRAWPQPAARSHILCEDDQPNEANLQSPAVAMKTTTDSDAAAVEKGRLRPLLRANRSGAFAHATAKADAEYALQSKVLAFQPAAQTSAIFIFLAAPEETATARLVNAYHHAGAVVLVPRLLGRTRMLAVSYTGWQDLAPGALGILAPQSTTEYLGQVDCVLVPGLAYTPAGRRLGYGGGYYDRWLALQPTARRIGLCFEHQLLEDLPNQPHDEVVDYVITEKRVLTTHARIITSESQI
ncbi:MAG: 5-formyltetrahydrofolate cyclo-ligase [Gammaproteobacteria bacterium]|nr:5-formyltetrahydrofolate cyclo-ligase [Gammaproteobacteria bacterium]